MDEHCLRVTRPVQEANAAFLAGTLSLPDLVRVLSQVQGGLDNSQAELLSLLRRAEADLEAIYFTTEQEEHARLGVRALAPVLAALGEATPTS